MMDERVENVAADWVQEKQETLVDLIATLALSVVPGGFLFSGSLAKRIKERLTWGYSDCEGIGSNVYRVTAMASTEVSLKVGILGGAKRYRATVPFDLEVDLDTGKVIKWAARPSEASVTEVRS